MTQPKRILSDHKIEGVDNTLTIAVLDDPGQGNACHEYSISFPFNARIVERVKDCTWNQGKAIEFDSNLEIDEDPLTRMLLFSFQNGPVKDFGMNGITQEALITICIDRLRSFQDGDYKCRENAIALTHLEEALMWLQKRTRDRIARGVEGTNNL
jgi:hypothetical protein